MQPPATHPPKAAPTKALIVPLSSCTGYPPLVTPLSTKIPLTGVSNGVNNPSATIGKRDSRNGELGTPSGITADFQTVKGGVVMLRERDGMKRPAGGHRGCGRDFEGKRDVRGGVGKVWGVSGSVVR